MKRHRHFRAARLSNHQGTRIATKQGRDNHGLHGCHRYISAVTFFVAVILRTSVSSVVLPFCSATPVNVHAFTVKWNQLTTSYEPTLGDSVAANSRLAQPHRARLCGNRSELVWNILQTAIPKLLPQIYDLK